MQLEMMTQEEMANYYVGEVVTLTGVLAVIAAAVMAVIIYKLFLSKKGSAAVPGGWKFTWN